MFLPASRYGGLYDNMAFMLNHVRGEIGEKTLECPECHGPLVSPDGSDGETVCKRCGLVISLVQTSCGFTEWAPKWLSNWDQNDSDTLREWLTTLRTVSCQLNLPDFPFREEAARLIRQKNEVFFRSQRFGKNKRETVAALIFLILRCHNKIRSLKEICRKLSLNHHLVKKYAWTMQEMTDLHKTFSPKDYLRQYGWELVSDPEIMEATEKLLMYIHEEISGNPVSIASGALYHICRGKKSEISKDEIGKAFHISGRTVYSNERRISRMLSTKGSKFQFSTANKVAKVTISQPER